MKVSMCTYTKNQINIKPSDNSTSYLIFTENKYFEKKSNEYCIYTTPNKYILNLLNTNLESKKFIGNFYHKENNTTSTTISFNSIFLQHIKTVLHRVEIDHCSSFMSILLSFMLYLPDKHYFLYEEVMTHWKLNIHEQKFISFLMKKKVLHLYFE